MDRANYDKFVALVKKSKKYDFHRVHWLRSFRRVNESISIDVFPFDSVPNNKIIAKIKLLLVKILQGMTDKKEDLSKFSTFYRFAVRFTSLIGKPFKLSTKQRLYDRVTLIGNGKGAKQISCYHGPFAYLNTISDVKYGFDDEGRNSDGWIVVNGNYRCYIDNDKGLLTGLQQIDSKWDWLGTNGIMRTGMQTVTDSNGVQRICFFGDDGTMTYGFVEINDKLYYFDEKTGERASGWKTIGEKKYYFDLLSGAAYKGRKSINDRTYCFDQQTGEQLLGLVRINNALYCFSDTTTDGVVHGLTENDGEFYCFNDGSGAARTGFVNINDVYYYFSPETGKAEEGIRWISKTSAYYFEKTGGVRK